MATPAFSLSNANHRAAAFRNVFIRPSGSPTTLFFQTLGEINGGVLNFPNYEENDSLGRNKSHAVGVTGKCNMKQGALVEIELLDSICDGNNDFLFQLSDAAVVPTEDGGVTHPATEGWIILTAAQVGVKAKIVLDGTPDNARHIELEWAGSLLLSEFNTAVKANIATDYFEGSTASGTFHAIGTYTTAPDGGKATNGHRHPNGVSKVEVSEVGGSYVSLGVPQNFKGSMEFLSEQDGLKRHSCFAIKNDFSFDFLQTDAATLLLLQTLIGMDVNVKITMVSGLIVTLENNVGISCNYTISGDFDKKKVVSFKLTGNVTIATLDSLVSGS